MGDGTAVMDPRALPGGEIKFLTVKIKLNMLLRQYPQNLSHALAQNLYRSLLLMGVRPEVVI